MLGLAGDVRSQRTICDGVGAMLALKLSVGVCDARSLLILLLLALTGQAVMPTLFLLVLTVDARSC